MKASELIKLLQKHPDADIIFWDGEDNHDIDDASLDEVNKSEIVLTNTGLIGC